MHARLLITACLALGLAVGAAEGSETRPSVLWVQLQDEAITPVTARFLERALADAAANGADLLIVELDTPGGLLQSTQRVVRGILASPVPVAVYVSPSGGRAASAGLFITLSSHAAAMAPGTRIGAAHPVQIGGLPIAPRKPLDAPADDERGPAEQSSPIEDKLVNDTAAWARGLAHLRGRNAEWAARAVTESLVLTDVEATEERIVELRAADLPDLLRQLDGFEVSLGQEAVRLRTANAHLQTLQMWWGEKLLAVVSSPNVVMFLLLFGVYGILFELYSPGWGVAGTLGAVALVLAFFGMSILPINYAGLALIFLALAMFVAEAMVTSFGALTAGGIVCLILGGMMLVDSPAGFMHVSLAVVAPVAVATGLITVFLLSRIVKAHRGRVQTGATALVDRYATALDSFTADDTGYRGNVFIHGERWRAHSTTPVAASASVRVTGMKGLTLEVETNGRSRGAPTVLT